MNNQETSGNCRWSKNPPKEAKSIADRVAESSMALDYDPGLVAVVAAMEAGVEAARYTQRVRDIRVRAGIPLDTEYVMIEPTWRLALVAALDTLDAAEAAEGGK